MHLGPLAAATTECWVAGVVTKLRMEETDPTSTGRPCSVSVRLHSEVAISYLLRSVGGSEKTEVLDEDRGDCETRTDEYLYDPEAFFGSYSSCREISHLMLAWTPVLAEFDLAAENWDRHHFLPHELADRILLRSFLPDLTRVYTGLAAMRPRYNNIDVCLSVWVTAVYNNPKALLLACKEGAATAAHCRWFMEARGECCVCTEDLAAPTGSSAGTVMLPCSHVYHTGCLLPWLNRRPTCPMCLRDMIMYLVAATKTPKGMFPGLES